MHWKQHELFQLINPPIGNVIYTCPLYYLFTAIVHFKSIGPTYTLTPDGVHSTRQEALDVIPEVR